MRVSELARPEAESVLPLTHHLWHRVSLAQQDFCFTQFVDDFFRAMSFLRLVARLLLCSSLSYDLDQFLEGRSASPMSDNLLHTLLGDSIDPGRAESPSPAS